MIFCEAYVSICIGPRRSPAALCVGPGALRVGFRLCRSGALCVPAISVSGAGARCVGPRRRSLCRSLAVCVAPRRSRIAGPDTQIPDKKTGRGAGLMQRAGPTESAGLTQRLLGPDTESARPRAHREPGPRRRHCLCRVPALSVWAHRSLTGLPLPCWGWSPVVLFQRSLRRGPALFVGPLLSVLVGRWRALSVSGRGGLCVGPRRSLCRPATLVLFVGLRHSLAVCFWFRARSSDACSSACHPFKPQRSACLSGPRAPSSDPRAAHRSPALTLSVHPSGPAPPRMQTHTIRRGWHPAPIRVPPSGPAGPQLRSACHQSSLARSRFPGKNPKPYCLED